MNILIIEDDSATAEFIAGAFTNAVPGIILQLVLIPAAMVVLDRTGALPFGDGAQTAAEE